MSSYLIKLEFSLDYLVVSYVRGLYVYDQIGKRYFDGLLGVVICNIGYGVCDVIEKLKDQFD